MPHRILIVEDDNVWLDIYQEWLYSAGYVSRAEEDPSNAKNAFRYFKPHLVVLDLELKGDIQQGFELAKYALRLRVPVIIVTAHSTYINGRLAFKHYQAVDFIPKQTLTGDIFLDAIRSALSSFEKLPSENEKKVVANAAEQSVDILAKLAQDDERIPGNVLTTRVTFFPNQASFLISWSNDVAGWGYFNPPFIGNMPTILKLLHPLAIEDFSEEETVFLDAKGFSIPPSDGILQDIGKELYLSITNPDPQSSTTSNELERLLARQERGPDRLHLYFSEQTAALASYPWELLHDGRRFLAQLQTSITRSIIYGESTGKLHIEWPARMLIVTPRPHDARKLSKDEEEAIRSEIESLGGSAKYDTLRISSPVTYTRVASELAEARDKGEPFDILYFDGHGEFGWQCNCGRINLPSEMKCGNSQCDKDFSDSTNDRPICQGFLLFEHESGASSPLGSLQSVAIFGGSGLKIVILSACNSAMIRETSLFNSVAPKLIETGIPAVVGMQFPISIKDTTAFFRQVFNSLTSRESITVPNLETAIKNARRQLDRNRWFYPVLYIRAQ